MSEPSIDVLALMDMKWPSGWKMFDALKFISIDSLLSFISDAKKIKTVWEFVLVPDLVNDCLNILISAMKQVNTFRNDEPFSLPHVFPRNIFVDFYQSFWKAVVIEAFFKSK